VTLTVQDAAGFKDAPQVVVLAKSPLMAMPETAKIPVVLLVTVTVLAALVRFRTRLGNVRDAGETATWTIPVPERLTDCAIPPTLNESEPVRTPVTVGVNVTLKVQLAPLPAKVAPHVVVLAKSPLIAMPDIATGLAWLFFTVIVFAEFGRASA
jgi:hypothetical protein